MLRRSNNERVKCHRIISVCDVRDVAERLGVEFHFALLFYHFWISMIYEETFTFVQLRDRIHIFGTQELPVGEFDIAIYNLCL